jgi:hypothetical protein
MVLGTRRAAGSVILVRKSGLADLCSTRERIEALKLRLSVPTIVLFNIQQASDVDDLSFSDFMIIMIKDRKRLICLKFKN